MELPLTTPDKSGTEQSKGRTTPSSALVELTERLTETEGVNDIVVLRKNGEIIFYRCQRPLLKNSVPFVVHKVKMAGDLFGFTGLRYAAIQRGQGKKMIVMAGNAIMAGLEVDARCLQKTLLESIFPLWRRANAEQEK